MYEWVTFAKEVTRDTVTVLNVLKRGAAVAAAGALVAGVGVGVAKGVEAVSQSPQERAVKTAIATHVPNISPDLRELVLKVNSENTYSKGFLYKKENHTLLNAIVAICNDGNALPSVQCDDAGQVKARLEQAAREREAKAKADEYVRKFRESFSSDGIIPR